MNVFYNEKGVGDTLLLFVKDIELEKRAFSKHGDVVRIYDQDTKELSGFNIFHASKYGQIVGTGQLEVNSEMKQLIQKEHFFLSVKSDDKLREIELTVGSGHVKLTKLTNYDKIVDDTVVLMEILVPVFVSTTKSY